MAGGHWFPKGVLDGLQQSTETMWAPGLTRTKWVPSPGSADVQFGLGFSEG